MSNRIIFCNSSQTIIQALFLANRYDSLDIYLTDELWLEHGANMTKQGYNIFLDRRNNILRFRLIKAALVILTLFFFKLWRIFSPKKNEVFINGSLNSLHRIFSFARANRVIYLDEGFQNYFEKFMHYENAFYQAYSTNCIKRWASQLVLNIYNKRIEKCIFMNEMLALESKTVDIARNIDKAWVISDIVSSLCKFPKSKSAIDNMFLSKIPNLTEINKPMACILTQPLWEDGHISRLENVRIFEKAIRSEVLASCEIFLKPHPREKADKYPKVFAGKKINLLPAGVPIELFQTLNVEFEYGLTFNSTAIFNNLFKNRVILDPNLKTDLEKSDFLVPKSGI